MHALLTSYITISVQNWTNFRNMRCLQQPILVSHTPLYTVSKKRSKGFYVISSIKLGRFSWNLLDSFLNKFSTKFCKQFPHHLNNVSTLPCETWNAHRVGAFESNGKLISALLLDLYVTHFDFTDFRKRFYSLLNKMCFVLVIFARQAVSAFSAYFYIWSLWLRCLLCSWTNVIYRDFWTALRLRKFRQNYRTFASVVNFARKISFILHKIVVKDCHSLSLVLIFFSQFWRCYTCDQGST